MPRARLIHIATALLCVAGAAHSIQNVLNVQNVPADVPGDGPAGARIGSDELVEATARRRLATEFARTSLSLAASAGTTSSDFVAAVDMIELACELDGDSPYLWRRAIEFSALADRSDLRDRAIKQLVRLDPDDDAALLLRIGLAIDERYQTVEERVDAYRWFVAADHGGADLGDAVRSRLALDLALLLRRTGDLDGFAEALTEAVALDSSNRDAAAIAAGFFRTYVEEPTDEAELLISLILADPTDPTAMTTLAALLLEQGAYHGAARVFDILGDLMASLRMATEDSILADHVIALAGVGDMKAAHEILDEREAFARNLELRMRFQEDPGLMLDAMQRKRVVGDVAPMLLAMRAALHVLGDEADSAVVAANAAISMYDRIMAGETRRELKHEILGSRLRIEQMLVIALFGRDSDVARIPDLLAEVTDAYELTDDAVSRVHGWHALREGRSAEAIELLRAPAATDGASSFGLARALAQVGRMDEANAQLLAVWHSQPGTLIGLLAAKEYEDRTAMAPPAPANAAALDALVATIPDPIQRALQESSFALDIRVRGRRLTYDPYEPLIIDIEIANNSPYPLAIGHDGPIHSDVVLLIESAFFGFGLRRETPPIVVRIDRTLRIEPHTRLTVPVDLRTTRVGNLLNDTIYAGSFLRIKAVLNPIGIRSAESTADRQILRAIPGPLGAEDRTRVLRIEGIEINALWIQRAIEGTLRGDEVKLFSLAALSQIAVQDTAGMNASQVAQLEAIGAAIVAGFDSLGPAGRAWITTILPISRIPAPIFQRILDSEEDWTLLAYLGEHVAALRDPVLARCLTFPPESFVHRMAKVTEERLIKAAER